MALLKKYEDFIKRVDDLGFMTLSNIHTGIPSMVEETQKHVWHTGIAEIDPWCWKDKAAEEKSVAYGCIIGGHKGFVSSRIYSLFYKAFHPSCHMEERWLAGQINQVTWNLWQTFERKFTMDTSDIRLEMGAKLKKDSTKIDKAIKELQQSFYITVSGSRCKKDKLGQPYGWPIIIYDKVVDWIPVEWMELNKSLNCYEAREKIFDIGAAMSKNINRSELAKILGVYI